MIKRFVSCTRKARLVYGAALLALCTGGAPGAAAAAEWPQFRGPQGQGVVDDAELPLEWSETDGVRWKTPIPGRGWSSPVFADARIWLTTAEETPLTDAERAEFKKQQASQPLGSAMAAASSVALWAVEIDAAAGKVIRRVKLFDVHSPAPIHGLNSFASPTPVLADGKCYCHFGSFGTACVNRASGEVVWRRQLAIDHMVGPGSSPAIAGGLLIVPCDGGDQQFIAALDLATGETRWQVNRPPIRVAAPDMRKAFCTPLAIEAAGRAMVVVPGAQWFIAYDPASGDEIWRVDHGSGFSNVPRPVFDGERVYLCTGFGRGQLWAVRPDGHGDVSASHVAWRELQQVPTMPSPVVGNGRVYMISDGGVATCLDAATGKTLWRHRVGGNFSASPLLGAERIYFCNHDGLTTVVAASADYQVLAENQLDGRLMASPAVIDGDLLLRTESHLYRIANDDQR